MADGTLLFDTKVNTAGVQSGLSGIGSVVKKLGIAAAVTAAAAAVGKFVKSSLEAGKEFDSSMSQIAATLGWTTDDIQNNVNGAGDAFADLRKKAQEMGRETVFSASESADALNILAMSGYDAEESIAMVEDVLHLAAAGSISMGDAASYVAGSMKGFGDETKSARYYADLMAKGATLANTNVSQLGEAMSEGASSAGAYNQTAESLTVSLLRLAEQNETGSAAATALNAAMKDLYTPSKQAKDALDELGVSAYDSEGKTRDFNTVINELDAALNAAGEDGLPLYTEEQKASYKQTIFGIQGLNAYNKMVVTGTDKQNEWAKALSGSSDGMGEAAKQYETMTDNLEGDIAAWESALEGFKIALSDKITPAIRRFVQGATTALGKLTSLLESSSFSEFTDKAVKMFSNAKEKIESIEWAEVGKTIAEKVISFFEGGDLQRLLTGLGELILSLLKGLGTAIGMMLLTFAQNTVSRVSQFTADILAHLVAFFMQLPGRIAEWLKNILGKIGEGISSIKESVKEKVQEIGEAIRDKIGEFLGALLEKGQELAIKLIEGLQNKLETIRSKANDIGNAIKDKIASFRDTIREKARELGEKIKEGLNNKLETIRSKANDIGNAIKDKISSFRETVRSKAQELGEKIKEGLNNKLETIRSKTKEIAEAIRDKIADYKNAVLSKGESLGSALRDGLHSMLSTIRDKAKELGQAVYDKLAEFPSKVVSIGSDIVSGIWNGISGSLGWIKRQITGWVGDVKTFLKNLFGIASPSKWARDVIGKMIPPGISIGFEKATPDMMKNIKGSLGYAMNEIEGMTAANFGTVDASYGVSSANSSGVLSDEDRKGMSQTFNFYDTQTSPESIRRKVNSTMQFGLAGGI